MSFFFTRRGANTLTIIACLSSLAIAYFYMEKYLFLTPCPLCYAQRIVFGIIAFVALLAVIFPAGNIGGKVYGILLFIISFGGAALSTRHLYLQSLPKGTLSSCGQDFYALVENTPFQDIVMKMITGTGDCGEIQWTVMEIGIPLNISIPGCGLIAFIAIAFWSLWHNTLKQHKTI